MRSSMTIDTKVGVVATGNVGLKNYGRKDLQNKANILYGKIYFHNVNKNITVYFWHKFWDINITILLFNNNNNKHFTQNTN